MADDKPPAKLGSDNRAHPRRRTILGGTVLDEQGGLFEVRILDISYSGARVQGETMLEDCSVVNLKLNRFKRYFKADVMWRRPPYVGLKFDPPIEPKRLPPEMRDVFDIFEANRKDRGEQSPEKEAPARPSIRKKALPALSFETKALPKPKKLPPASNS